jgi:malonyl CoA-acyl carrier protein transacylase
MALESHGERGGMTAILADPDLYGEDFIRSRSELAGVNFSTNFVVSAREADLALIGAELKRRGLVYQRLPVSFPFHSRWIDGAKEAFAPAMRLIGARSGRLPLACCDRAEILTELPEEFFWDIVRRPIRFRETAALVEQLGLRRYIDVGPAGTLATFLKYGAPAATSSTVHSILTPFGGDQKNFAVLTESIGH